jgi:ADP-ribosylglycohydrolase
VKKRIVGCLLGSTVGDAVEAPVEFMWFDDLRLVARADGVTGYLPARQRCAMAVPRALV